MELVVVLTIMFILFAIAVPAITGYIEDAKEVQVVLEARQVNNAAQLMGAQFYDENNGSWGTWNSADTSYGGISAANQGGKKLNSFIKDLCELSKWYYKLFK